MNINANTIAGQEVRTKLLTNDTTLAITSEDGDVSITARSLLLNGSQIVPGTGSGLNWKGNFNIATNYLVDDAVSYQGSSYICIQNSVGNYPDNYAYWNLMAQQGGQGPVGARGETGNRGPQGLSSSFFNYRINTDPFDGNTESGYLQFDNANDPGTQRMYINFIDSLGNDITPFLSFLNEGDQIVIQLQSDSTQNQVYLVNGSPVNAPDWLAVPIVFGSSTVEFSQDDQVLLIINLVGAEGPAGAAATINVNTTTTLPSGSSATVVNVGSISAALLDFGIPAGSPGLPGSPGAAATINVNSTTTLPSGSSATVVNVGSSSAALLDFGIPGSVNFIKLANSIITNTVGNVYYPVFNLNIPANTTYFLNGQIFVSSAGSQGIDSQIVLGSLFPTDDFRLFINYQLDNNTSTSRQYTLTPTVLSILGPNISTPINQIVCIQIQGYITTTTADTFQYNARRSNVGNANAITVYKNSWLSYV